MKNGDEKVKVIAVANSKLITEMNTNIFIDKNAKPLKKLKIKNFLSIFRKIEKYSFVNIISRIKGIIPAAFLKTANCITEYLLPRNFITTMYKSMQSIAMSIVVTAR